MAEQEGFDFVMNFRIQMQEIFQQLRLLQEEMDKRMDVQYDVRVNLQEQKSTKKFASDMKDVEKGAERLAKGLDEIQRGFFAFDKEAGEAVQAVNRIATATGSWDDALERVEDILKRAGGNAREAQNELAKLLAGATSRQEMVIQLEAIEHAVANLKAAAMESTASGPALVREYNKAVTHLQRASIPNLKLEFATDGEDVPDLARELLRSIAGPQAQLKKNLEEHRQIARAVTEEDQLQASILRKKAPALLFEKQTRKEITEEAKKAMGIIEEGFQGVDKPLKINLDLDFIRLQLNQLQGYEIKLAMDKEFFFKSMRNAGLGKDFVLAGKSGKDLSSGGIPPNAEEQRRTERTQDKAVREALITAIRNELKAGDTTTLDRTAEVDGLGKKLKRIDELSQQEILTRAELNEALKKATDISQFLASSSKQGKTLDEARKFQQLESTLRTQIIDPALSKIEQAVKKGERGPSSEELREQARIDRIAEKSARDTLINSIMMELRAGDSTTLDKEAEVTGLGERFRRIDELSRQEIVTREEFNEALKKATDIRQYLDSSAQQATTLDETRKFEQLGGKLEKELTPALNRIRQTFEKGQRPSAEQIREQRSLERTQAKQARDALVNRVLAEIQTGDTSSLDRTVEVNKFSDKFLRLSELASQAVVSTEELNEALRTAADIGDFFASSTAQAKDSDEARRFDQLSTTLRNEFVRPALKDIKRAANVDPNKLTAQERILAATQRRTDLGNVRTQLAEGRTDKLDEIAVSKAVGNYVRNIQKLTEVAGLETVTREEIVKALRQGEGIRNYLKSSVEQAKDPEEAKLYDQLGKLLEVQVIKPFLDSLEKLQRGPKDPAPLVSEIKAERIKFQQELKELAGRANKNLAGEAQEITGDDELAQNLRLLAEAIRTRDPATLARAGNLPEEIRKAFTNAINAADGENVAKIAKVSGEAEKTITQFNKELDRAAKLLADGKVFGVFEKSLEEMSEEFLLQSKLFRAQRNLLVQEPAPTFDEINKDLKTLSNQMRKLDLLELERDSAEAGAEFDKLTTAIGNTRRQIVAQQDRMVIRMLTGTGTSQVPGIRRERIDENNTRLAFTESEEILPNEQAMLRLRQVFADNFGKAISIAIENNKATVQSLLEQGLTGEASKAQNFGQDDFLREAFQEGGPTQRVAAAMRQAADGSAEFAKNSARAYGTYKQLQGVMNKMQGDAEMISRIEAFRAEKARLMAGYYRAIRGLSYTIGGFAIGITAGQKVRESLTSGVQLEAELAQIQGILPRRSAADTELLKGGITSTASTYGADLIETAQAAKILAQTGIGATAVLRELDVTLRAQRGIGITIEQMQELQIAIRAVAGEADRLTATAAVLDKIARTEAAFAITAADIADAIKVAAPVVNQFAGDMRGLNDVFDLTIGLSTAMVEQLRITGNQAGNALKFILARLARPEVLNKLQDTFGLRIASDEEGKEILPLGDLLDEIYAVYDGLASAQKQQFAVVLAGGRRVNAALAFLDSYDKVQEAARKSAAAFGDTQERVAINIDTLSGALDRLNTNFNIFVEQLKEGTGLGAGLAVITNQVTKLLSLSQGSTVGAGTGILGLLLGGSLAVAGVKGGYSVLADLGTAIRFGGSRKDQTLLRLQKRAQDLGTTAPKKLPSIGKTLGKGALGALLSPTVGVAAGLVGIVTALGLWNKFQTRVSRFDKFKVAPETLEQLGFFESTQFTKLMQFAENLGSGNLEETVGLAGRAAASEGVRNTLARIGARGGIPDTSPLGEQSPETASTLLETLKELNSIETRNLFGTDEQGRIPLVETVDAFIDQLGTAGEHFKEMEDDALRVASATQFMALAALAANAPFEDLKQSIQESATTLQAQAVESLKAQIDTRGFNAVNSFPSLIRWGDEDSMQGVMDAQLRRFSGFFGLVGEKMFEEAEGAELKERLEEVFFPILASSETIGEAFARLSGLLKEDPVAGAALQDVLARNIQNILVGENAEALINAGLGDIFNATPASNEERVERNVESLLDASFEQVQRTMIAMVQAARPGDQRALDVVTQAVSEMPWDSFKASMLGAGDAVGAFRDKIVEFLISMAREFEKLDVEEGISRRLGQDFDRTEEEFNLGRRLLSDFRNLEGEIQVELARDADRLKILRDQQQGATDLNEAARRLQAVEGVDGDTTTVVEDPGAEADRLEQKIEIVKQDIARFFREGEGLSEFLDTDEALRFRQVIEEMASEFGEFGRISEHTAAAVDAMLLKITSRTRALLLSREREAIASENLLASTRSRLELEIETTKLLSTQSAQLQAQVPLYTEIFLAEQRALEAELRRNSKDGELSLDDQIKLRREAAVFFSEMESKARELQATLRDGFTSQVQENIRSALSGVGSVVADPSIFSGLFQPGQQGQIRNFFSTLLDPVGQTFSQRISEGLTESLAEIAQESNLLTDLFASPEVRMRDEMINGGAIAAQMMYDAHVLGLKVGVGALTSEQAVMTLQANQDIAEDTLKLEAAQGKREGLGAQLKQVGGLVGGSIAGGLTAKALDRDDRFASLGASIGTGVGSLVPVIGPILGGVIGGALGGLFGGKKEEEEVKAQIRVLQAIERAQLETIQTIENQTDLLSPGNRLINLPTGFNVPQFNPTGGGLQVNIDFSGANIGAGVDPDDFAALVQDAVVDGIANGRKTGSRSFRKF